MPYLGPSPQRLGLPSRELNLDGSSGASPIAESKLKFALRSSSNDDREEGCPLAGKISERNRLSRAHISERVALSRVLTDDRFVRVRCLERLVRICCKPIKVD